MFSSFFSHIRSLLFFVGLVTLFCSQPAGAQTEPKPLRYISITGGAILGLGPLFMLQKIEHDAGRPISELVDGFIGSSAGAMIAAALCLPDKANGGQPLYTVDELIDIFTNEFSSGMFGGPWGLEKLLERKLGDAYMSQTLRHVMITAYHTEKRQVILFDSEQAQDPRWDLPVWQATRASASLTFPFGSYTARFNTSDEAGPLIDAGQVGNIDPTPFLIEALKASPRMRDPKQKAIIYALGTGFGHSWRSRSQGNIEVVTISPDFANTKAARFTYEAYGAAWWFNQVVSKIWGSEPWREWQRENVLINIRGGDPTTENIAIIQKQAEAAMSSNSYVRMYDDLVDQQNHPDPTKW